MVTAHLEHPNIVPLYELGIDEKEEMYLAMKLVGGTSWKELLHPQTKKQKKVSAKYSLLEHLEILLSVCNAVAFAHSKNIIHNDLKPANIMVGEFGEVLVMDWGIAVSICESTQPFIFHKSTIKDPIGTPCYMAPELAEGNGGNIGPWTDVYLLGAILYEILMGKSPHAGETVWEVLFSVMEKMPSFASEVPLELQKVCLKALAKKTKERYQNVEEFQKSIEDFLKHHQSIAISDKAQKLLLFCQREIEQKSTQKKLELGKIFRTLFRAIVSFEEALQLWDKNKIAAKNLQQARLVYAKFALENKELILAEFQIEELDEKHPEKSKLREKVQKAKEARLRAQRTEAEQQKSYRRNL